MVRQPSLKNKNCNMPIPSPSSNEKQREFITRCYTTIKDEYNRAAAFAICYDKWKNKDKTKKTGK